MEKYLKMGLPKYLSLALLGSSLIIIGLWAYLNQTPDLQNPFIPVQFASQTHFTDEIELRANFENSYVLKGKNDEEVFMAVQVLTGKKQASDKRTPLNVSLVIDQSGSMSDEGKLDYAVKAAEMAIDNLTSEDYLSLVTYESGVRIWQKSQKVGDKSALKAMLRRLRPEGSTFLSGGMEAGYSEVANTYRANYINRVLLFSDGLANQGITENTDLQEIAKNKYQKNHIAISTFGLGLGFNENLMTNLAEYGRGNYYYIDKSQKIPEIFRREMQGLLSVVAQKAQVKIQFPISHFEVQKVYGYEYKVIDNEVVVDFNDLFAEEEKVILLKLRLKKTITQAMDFNVQLTYEDVKENNTAKKLAQNLSLNITEDVNLLAQGLNEAVSRHKILFLANEKFEEATLAVDNRNYEKAKTILKENEVFLDKSFQKVKPDSALVKQYDMNKKYSKDIETIKEKSETEIKMMQKSEKSSNYMLKKKKY
jgi:Ca-activated chloride channel family protein